MRSRASFTLIELLVVIGIVAILSVVVIVVLNPAQMLKQARDSNRLSDLNTLTKAVSLFETDQLGGSVGSASTTYFSVADPSATSSLGTHCQGAGLPSAPSDWTYRCPASSTLRLTNGTGWLPVNFDQMSFRALAALPVDPVNTTSSGQYYSYTPGGSFALTAALESDKYLTTKATQDNGYDPGRYEQGSDLALVARSQGLLGWWKLDEGGGATTSTDSSGMGNHGTMHTATTTIGSLATTTNCKIGNCAAFDGTNDFIGLGIATATTGFTLSGWFNANTLSVPQGHRMIQTFSAWSYFSLQGDAQATPHVSLRLNGSQQNIPSGFLPAANTWYHFATTWSDGNPMRIYVNGEQKVASSNFSGPLAIDTVPGYIGKYTDPAYAPFSGRLDEIRAYSRALSAAEIMAIYNATK